MRQHSLFVKGDNIGSSNPQVPIIAVTARAMQTEEKKCMDAGMNGYLRKPYRASELLDAIEPFTDRPTKPRRKLKTHKKESTILIPVNLDNETLQSLQQSFVKEGSEHLTKLQQSLHDRKVVRILKESDWFKEAATSIGARQVVINAIRLKGVTGVERLGCNPENYQQVRTRI